MSGPVGPVRHGDHMNPPRYIQAWNHDGSPHVIHAAVDQPHDRETMGLGRLGIFTRTACGTRFVFMRLVHSNSDQPTYTDDGNLANPGQAGLDWDADLRSLFDHRCEKCSRKMRKLAAK